LKVVLLLCLFFAFYSFKFLGLSAVDSLDPNLRILWTVEIVEPDRETYQISSDRTTVRFIQDGYYRVNGYVMTSVGKPAILMIFVNGLQHQAIYGGNIPGFYAQLTWNFILPVKYNTTLYFQLHPSAPYVQLPDLNGVYYHFLYIEKLGF